MILFQLNGSSKLLSNITIDFGKPKVSKILWEHLALRCFEKWILNLSWIFLAGIVLKIQKYHLSKLCPVIQVTLSCSAVSGKTNIFRGSSASPLEIEDDGSRLGFSCLLSCNVCLQTGCWQFVSLVLIATNRVFVFWLGKVALDPQFKHLYQLLLIRTANV